MRFVSREVGGYRVYAVTGNNTVSFAVDFLKADTSGLLGFAVERSDPTEDERYFMYGMKVFESVVPHPGENTHVSTYDHPVQSFVWDDFTAKPGREYTYWFHPLKGKPKKLDRSAEPIAIKVRTEPQFCDDEHDIFFNRGVASSQAYSREFNNRPPSEITDPAEKARAEEWLSRKLDDAIFKFIANAGTADTLLCCFYEFEYLPVARALSDAAGRGVNVQIILDAKENAYTDKKGVPHASFPLAENKQTVTNAGLPASAIACWRKHNTNNIEHNKFMVLLRGETAAPSEVWTGSTNISTGGIFGQTNVGHWVRNPAVATRFRDYWLLLKDDPGAAKEDDRKTADKKRDDYRKAVMALASVPTRWQGIPDGTTTVFSPRSGAAIIEMYAASLDEATSVGCVTLAFGINKRFKQRLLDNTPESHISFLLLEKRDRPNKRSKEPFEPLTAANNVYQAWGSFLRDPLYQWTRETNARKLGLNTHVAYVHSKFLLKDPLGADPIVITGSANFSDASTNDNDENMLLVRGNQRVADIYFTEFNRLFNHYYFRSVQEAQHDRKPAEGNGAADASASLFLSEKDDWLAKYAPHKLRRKRVDIYVAMAGAITL